VKSSSGNTQERVLTQEQAELIESLVKRIESRLFTIELREEVKELKVKEWVDTEPFKDFVTQHMFRLLARNYLSNLALAGRLTNEVLDQFLNLAEKPEGAKLIALNFMALSLELDHDFDVPEDEKMLFVPLSECDGKPGTYFI
jgi:hypothetical protein